MDQARSRRAEGPQGCSNWTMAGNSKRLSCQFYWSFPGWWRDGTGIPAGLMAGFHAGCSRWGYGRWKWCLRTPGDPLVVRPGAGKDVPPQSVSIQRGTARPSCVFLSLTRYPCRRRGRSQILITGLVQVGSGGRGGESGGLGRGCDMAEKWSCGTILGSSYCFDPSPAPTQG